MTSELCSSLYTVGSEDDTAALQQWLDDAKALHVPARWAPGRYKITSPLYVTRTPFQTLSVIGAGRANGARGGPTGAYTLLDATAIVDRPALIVDNGRGVRLEGFGIIGPNSAPVDVGYGAIPADPAAWISPGVRDSRWSPQCAIAIDATTAAIPPDGGYPSLSYQGGGGGSADIFISVAIANHVVGIMLAPGLSFQGDQIDISQCQIVGVRAGVAIGQSQANGVWISRSNIHLFHTAVDWGSYGKQQGSTPNVRECQIATGFQVISGPQSFKAGAFENIFSESVRALGNIGKGLAASQFPAHFKNVSLHLSQQHKLPPVVAELFCPSKFECASFISNTDVFNFRNIAPMLLDNCAFAGSEDVVRKRLVGIQPDGQGRAVHRGTSFRGAGVRVEYPAGAEIGYSLPARFDAAIGLPAAWAQGVEYMFRPGADNSYIDGGGISNIQMSGDAITFHVAPATDVLAGDILLWTVKGLPLGHGPNVYSMPAVKVTTVDGANVIAKAIFDPEFYLTTETRAKIAVTEWAPGVALAGDLQAGSTVVQNLSSTTVLRAGDWIKSPVGLGNRARVIALDGSAAIMNRPATATVAASSLYFGRLVVAEAAPAFAA